MKLAQIKTHLKSALHTSVCARSGLPI